MMLDKFGLSLKEDGERSLFPLPLLVFDTSLVDFDALDSQHALFGSKEICSGR